MMININGVMPMCSPHGYHYNGIPFNTDMQKHLLKKHPVHKIAPLRSELPPFTNAPPPYIYRKTSKHVSVCKYKNIRMRH